MTHIELVFILREYTLIVQSEQEYRTEIADMNKVYFL